MVAIWGIEVEWERLVKSDGGPAGFYDPYLVKYKRFKQLEKVFRLNQKGAAFLERLRRRGRFFLELLTHLSSPPL